MITQKFMLGNATGSNFYLDWGNALSIEGAINAGYLTIASGGTNKVNVTVKKDAFLYTNYHTYINNSADPFFNTLPLKANYNFTLSNKTTPNITVNDVKGHMAIVPYLSGSKKLYMDYTPKINSTSNICNNIDSAVSAGYIKKGNSVGSWNGGTVYSCTFLKDCLINYPYIFFGSRSFTDDNVYCQQNILPIKKDTILKMYGLHQIYDVQSTSFFPDIDFNNVYTIQEAANAGVITVIDLDTSYTITALRDIILEPLYNNELGIDYTNHLVFGFLPIKSGTTCTFTSNVSSKNKLRNNAVFVYK